MKKILLLHPIYTSKGVWEKSLIENFKALGLQTHSIDYRAISYIYRFKKPFYQYYLLKEIKKYINVLNPHFIFVSKGELLSPLILEELKKFHIPLVNWIGDGPWVLDFVRSVYDYYDFFYTFDSKSIELLQNPKNMRYLSFGFDTLMDREFVTDNVDYYRSDLSFVGSPTKERVVLLDYLKDLRLNIKIWGPSEWKNTQFKHLYMGKALFGKEMYFAYKMSKTVINVHYGFNQEDCLPYNGINHRFYETFGIGTYCLSNFQADMDRDFESKFVCYRRFEELGEKIEFLFGNDRYRNEIANNMQNEILQKHTLLQKLRSILKDLDIR